MPACWIIRRDLLTAHMEACVNSVRLVFRGAGDHTNVVGRIQRNQFGLLVRVRDRQNPAERPGPRLGLLAAHGPAEMRRGARRPVAWPGMDWGVRLLARHGRMLPLRGASRRSDATGLTGTESRQRGG